MRLPSGHGHPAQQLSLLPGALLLTADVVDHQLTEYLRSHGVQSSWGRRTDSGALTASQRRQDLASGRRNADRSTRALRDLVTQENPRRKMHGAGSECDAARAQQAHVEVLEGRDPVKRILGYARSHAFTRSSSVTISPHLACPLQRDPARSADSLLRGSTSVFRNDLDQFDTGSLKVSWANAAGVARPFRSDGTHELSVRASTWVVGYFGRPQDTIRCCRDLEVIPRKPSIRGSHFEEMDTDAIFGGIPGWRSSTSSRTRMCRAVEAKRWEDVQVIPGRGHRCLTTMNVQHLSLLSFSEGELLLFKYLEQSALLVVSTSARSDWITWTSPRRLVDEPAHSLPGTLSMTATHLHCRPKTAVGSISSKWDPRLLRAWVFYRWTSVLAQRRVVSWRPVG